MELRAVLDRRVDRLEKHAESRLQQRWRRMSTPRGSPARMTSRRSCCSTWPGSASRKRCVFATACPFPANPAASHNAMLGGILPASSMTAAQLVLFRLYNIHGLRMLKIMHCLQEVNWLAACVSGMRRRRAGRRGPCVASGQLPRLSITFLPFVRGQHSSGYLRVPQHARMLQCTGTRAAAAQQCTGSTRMGLQGL